ncbi:MAG TPA: homoserine kinase [Paracoccaceae bacterium]|nr:homoserine kinase [Paracoccaceae bacterium]
MAVYTQLSSDDLAALIAQYDVGDVVSAKGIAEGVQNSNFLVDTTGKGGAGSRYILTIYESQTVVKDLPFFLGLLDHLSASGCPVPQTIHDRSGASFRKFGNKALALIEFLSGISLDHPTSAQALSVGRALAQLHLASGQFAATRENDLGPAGWDRLAAACASDFASMDPALGPLVQAELASLASAWPQDLPRGAIHADLFPDNVLMLGDTVTGLIDFYFACTDMFAYDVAITHAAWCFSADGKQFDPAISAALLEGYEALRPLSVAERAALPVLARGAALRFTLTRAYDWVNTPADALVTKKDPMAFARRLQFYSAHPELFSQSPVA